MEHHKKQALGDYRERLVSEAPNAGRVLERLDKTQLAVRRIESAADRAAPQNNTPRTWFLYCEPEPAFRERFDLAPELLVTISKPSRASRGQGGTSTFAVRTPGT